MSGTAGSEKTQNQAWFAQAPHQILANWYDEAHSTAPLPKTRAVCLSTVDENNRPHARFVALKRSDADGLIFATSLESPKALQIQANNLVALAMWWEHTGKQIRVEGTVAVIEPEESERLFRARSRGAQLVSAASQQSRPIAGPEAFAGELGRLEAEYRNRDVPRPQTWAGFRVQPAMYEFLNFDKERNHVRVRFTLLERTWQREFLQP